MTKAESEFMKFSKKIDINYLLNKVPIYGDDEGNVYVVEDDKYVVDIFPNEVINTKAYRVVLHALKAIGIDDTGYYLDNIQNWWYKYVELYRRDNNLE